MEAIHVYFSKKIQQVIGFSNIMHVKTAFSIQQAIHFLKDYDNNYADKPLLCATYTFGLKI